MLPFWDWTSEKVDGGIVRGSGEYIRVRLHLPLEGACKTFIYPFTMMLEQELEGKAVCRHVQGYLRAEIYCRL